ncbi:Dipeptidyl aminopeptidase BIII [Alphaproteobacteria bacterium]
MGKMHIKMLVVIIFAVIAVTVLVIINHKLKISVQKAENVIHESRKLIPRQIIFGNPDKATVRISPNGEYVSYVAPYNGVLNVYVAPIGKLDEAYVVTNDTKRGIRGYFWAMNNSQIVYLQDANGDENWHVYRVDIAARGEREVKDLTPFEGVRADINNVSENFTDQILISLNKRRTDYHDLYSLDIRTGELALLYQNDTYADVITDDNYEIRFGMKQTEDGGVLVDKLVAVVNEDKQGKVPGRATAGNTASSIVYPVYQQVQAEIFMTVPPEDIYTTHIVGFNKSCDAVYLLDSRSSDTSRLYVYDLKTDKQTFVYANDKVDIGSILLNAKDRTLQAVSYTYTTSKWDIIDPSIKQDFEYLQSLRDGELNVLSKTLDDKIWVVVYQNDRSPAAYYVYDKNKKEANYLFSNYEKLGQYELAAMHPVLIQSRDNLTLISYLTLPPSVQDSELHVSTDTTTSSTTVKTKHSVPLVLYVHGGPTVRDGWGLDQVHQWLANRGYAVLSVNYRGSTGFGKAFINAGNGEWAGKMHDDLIDAVNWAVTQGITTKDKVAIMGGSYGGYATLVGLTLTPDVFACGVDIVGMSNLVTTIESIPPYWTPMRKALTRKIGADTDTEEGRKYLLTKSPLTYVDRINKPLLIGQGANDPRVKQAESEQIVDAMKSRDIPVTYVLYPDEGHGFARPENRLSFYAIVERFFASYLGGTAEKVGEDFKNSSIIIKHGQKFLKNED